MQSLPKWQRWGNLCTRKVTDPMPRPANLQRPSPGAIRRSRSRRNVGLPWQRLPGSRSRPAAQAPLQGLLALLVAGHPAPSDWQLLPVLV